MTDKEQIDREQLDAEAADIEQQDAASEVEQDERDEAADVEQSGDESSESAESDDEGETVITMGDKPVGEKHDKTPAPQWVKDMRTRHRETVSALRKKEQEANELRQRLEAATGATTQAPVLGAKPTLDQFDFDAEKYEGALTRWFEDKRKHDERIAEQQRAEKQQQDEWASTLSRYQDAKRQLKVADFDDAEGAVLSSLSQTQQGIIVQGAANPALVVYAIGNDPQLLEELTAVKDPVKFAFRIAAVERELKVSKQKPATKPEKLVRGNGSPGAAGGSELEKLRAEAEKTGNLSEVIKYKRRMREAS